MSENTPVFEKKTTRRQYGIPEIQESGHIEVCQCSCCLVIWRVVMNLFLTSFSVWIWIWIYTSQKPINGYKRDGTGRAHQLFLYRSPLLLKSSMFIKIVLGGHYNHVSLCFHLLSLISDCTSYFLSALPVLQST